MNSSPSPPSARLRIRWCVFAVLLLLALGAEYFHPLRFVFVPLMLVLWLLPNSWIDRFFDCGRPLPGEPPATDPKFDRSFRARFHRWSTNLFYPDKDYPKPDPPQ